MSTPAVSTIPKTKRRFVTSLAMIIGVCALVFGITVAGMVSSQPANAAIWDFCSADQTFAAPARSNNTADAAGTVTPVTIGKHEVQQVATSDNPAQAYAGAGLSWQTFGQSCADFATGGTTMIGNFLFEIFALVPARLLGAMLQLVFMPTLANMVIGDGAGTTGILSGALNRMHSSIFLSWAPFIIGLGLVAAMWNVARKRTSKGLGDFGWIMGVIIIVGILASPAGVDLIRKVNNATADATLCATFAVSGACTDDTKSSSATDLFSSEMVETLAAGTWGAGAIGDMSTQLFTASSITFRAHDGVPKIHDSNKGDGAMVVPIPHAAIPRTGDQPTWAEVWRWTGTYTAAEMAAMRDNAALRCTQQNSPKLESLSYKDDTDVTDKNKQTYSELCVYKWIVRAAMISEIAAEHPGSYADMAGSGTLRIAASISGGGIAVLTIGIAIAGMMVLFYQFEMIGLILLSPIVGLIAMKRPDAGKRYVGLLASTVVKRVAVGFTLGLILMMISTLQVAFLNLSTGPLGITGLPIYLYPVIGQVISVLCMIVGFALMRRVGDLLQGAVGLEQGDGAGAKAGSVGKKALAVGVTAATGALGAGSGLAVKGAIRAGAGALTRPKGNVAGAAVAGTKAGRGVRFEEAMIEQEREAEARAAEKKAAAQATARESLQRQAPVMTNGKLPDAVNEAFTPGPPAGSSPEVRALWAQLMTTSAATVRWDEQVSPLRAQRDRTADAMRRAQEALDRFDQTRSDLVDEYSAQYVAQGKTGPEARDHAEMDVAKRHSELTLTLRRAEQSHTEADVNLQHVLDGPSDWAMAAQDHAARSTDMSRSIADLHLQDAQEQALFVQYTNALRMQAPVQRPAPDDPDDGNPFWG